MMERIEILISNAVTAVTAAGREWERLYGPAELAGLDAALVELGQLAEQLNQGEPADLGEAAWRRASLPKCPACEQGLSWDGVTQHLPGCPDAPTPGPRFTVGAGQAGWSVNDQLTGECLFDAIGGERAEEAAWLVAKACQLAAEASALAKDPQDDPYPFWVEGGAAPRGPRAEAERYSDRGYRESLPCSECGAVDGCVHFPRVAAAAEAIEALTGNELSPSTVHLLALERLMQAPSWLDPGEAERLVAEIVAEYGPAPAPGGPRGPAPTAVDLGFDPTAGPRAGVDEVPPAPLFDVFDVEDDPDEVIGQVPGRNAREALITFARDVGLGDAPGGLEPPKLENGRWVLRTDVAALGARLRPGENPALVDAQTSAPAGAGLFDLRLTPEALKAAAAWVAEGENMADVELLVDDRMLLVAQGDERAAFDTDGSPGSAEYLAVAPLDREPAPAGLVPLANVLARVSECEAGLRDAGWTAAANEVYALGLELGRPKEAPAPTVEIESDGVNPPRWVVPEGVAVVWTDWGEGGETVTLVGPHDGPLERGGTS